MQLTCKKDARDLMNFTVKFGRIMLFYGAEIYRVEDTIYRILSSFEKNQTVNVLVSYNFILVSLIYEGSNMTTMRRVNIGDKNLEKISLLNNLSRRIVAGEVEDLDCAFFTLKAIRNTKPYRDITVVLALVISAPFFAVMFGGTFEDYIYSFIIMALEAYFLIYATKYKLMFYLSNFLGALIATVGTNWLANYFPIQNPQSIIIVGLMPLVPGVQITNSVRDFMAGDYMSGLVGTMAASFISIAIALGVVLGLRLS